MVPIHGRLHTAPHAHSIPRHAAPLVAVCLAEPLLPARFHRPSCGAAWEEGPRGGKKKKKKTGGSKVAGEPGYGRASKDVKSLPFTWQLVAGATDELFVYSGNGLHVQYSGTAGDRLPPRFR